jgi:hypothetical protein
LGHALVDPEQRALLHLGEVVLVEVEGAAILAVPGVGELVGEEVGFAELVGWKPFSPTPLSEDWPCSRPSPPATSERVRRK